MMMLLLPSWLTGALLLTGGIRSLAAAQGVHCPAAGGPRGLAFQMVESDIARGQGLHTVNASTGLLKIGLFQQALYESIAATSDAEQKQRWHAWLEDSIASTNSTFTNATKNTELALARFSVGSAMIRLHNETRDAAYIPAIKALQQSVYNQKRNHNGGLWSYDNQPNRSAHANISSISGMYSYAPFAIMSREFNYASDTNYLNEAAAWRQLTILQRITERDDGLLVHGYDPIKNHSWAQGVDGASPVVWSRSLAWYTLGVVNSIELLETQYSDLIYNFKALYHDLVTAQLDASDRSLAIGGSYGVWQVVDRPAVTVNGSSNFIEASSTLMTVYSLLRGARMGWLEDDPLRWRAQTTGLAMFQDIKQRYLLENVDNTLSLDGTTAVASLSGEVDYEYYVTRPVVLNDLIGTSAFILAALEAEKLC